MSTHQQPAGQHRTQIAAYAGCIRHRRRGPWARRRRSIHWIGGHAAQHPCQEGAAGGVTRRRHGSEAGAAGLQDAPAAERGEGACRDGPSTPAAALEIDTQAVASKVWPSSPCMLQAAAAAAAAAAGTDGARCADRKRSGERSRTFAVPVVCKGGGGAAARPCACRGDPSNQPSLPPVQRGPRPESRSVAGKRPDGSRQGFARAWLLPVPSTAATTTLCWAFATLCAPQPHVQQRLLLHSSKKAGGARSSVEVGGRMVNCRPPAMWSGGRQ